MTRRDRFSGGSIAIAIAVSVFAIGGAPRWAQAIVAFVLALGLVAQLRSRRVLERTPPLLFLLGAVALWTLVQAMPLPASVVESLSSTLDAYRADGALLAGVSPRSTLSMDATASLRAATFFVALSALAALSLRLSTSERGRYFLVAVVAAVAGGSAIVAGVHELVNAARLYGAYEPSQASPPIMGPLLNSNHLGCLMAIGVVTNLGLLLYPKQDSRARLVWAALGVGCLAVNVASLSRGGVLALIAGLVVMGGTLVAQRLGSREHRSRHDRTQFYTRVLPLGVVVVCSMVLAVYVGAEGMVLQLESTSVTEIEDPRSKFAAWRSATELVEESPWVGVGKGAFEPSFTRVHPASAIATFAYLENEPLQAVVEWGIPACIVFGALVLWLVLTALRRWDRGPLAASALGAMMVVGFQSNFDFGIELLGIAAPFVALVATVTYVPLRESSNAKPAWSRGIRAGHTLAVVAGGMLLLSPSTRTLEEDHQALRAGPPTQVVLSSIEDHPLDYFGYAVLAEHLLRERDARSTQMLNHALRLHPTHGGLHRMAARLLLRADRSSQAADEYAAAIRGSRDPRAVIGEVLLRLDPELAARALPTGLDPDATVRTLRQAERLDVAVLWLDRLLTVRDDLHTAELLYKLASERGELTYAERAARRRCAIVPGTRCRLELATLLARTRRPEQVIAQLHDVAEWGGSHRDRLAGWLLLCDAYIEQKATSEARACLRHLEASGLIKPGSAELKRRMDELKPPTPLP